MSGKAFFLKNTYIKARKSFNIIQNETPKTKAMNHLTGNKIHQYHHLTEIVKENLHLLKTSETEYSEVDSLVRFNDKIVISRSKPFLEAIKNAIGGEIIEDQKIGVFLSLEVESIGKTRTR